MKIIIIDNYDSFTYNLVQLVRKSIGSEPTVVRNDQVELSSIQHFDKILLSPGPGIPAKAGLLLDIIQCYAATKPMLGICLGHQAIGQIFGAELLKIDQVFHGLSTPIKILQNSNLFLEIPKTFFVGRYHSWALTKNNFPKELCILAEDEQGSIMAIKHHEFNVFGLQFHPESILTTFGEKIMNNWINLN